MGPVPEQGKGLAQWETVSPGLEPVSTFPLGTTLSIWFPFSVLCSVNITCQIVTSSDDETKDIM